MKVAVTAASGQLGRKIIQALIPQLGRDNIIGLARTPAKAADLGIEIRKGDYNNSSDFVTGLQGIDVVCIISSNDAPEKRPAQHRNVFEGAKTAGVRKIVYTSIYGEPGSSTFDSIILANRQSEQDLQQTGLEWAIGRNGLYLDADLEALPNYQKEGKIVNCAANGKCAYTSREELAAAYVKLITNDSLNGHIYNLCGEPVTQQELTDAINIVYDTQLRYESMSVAEYRQDRIAAHGEFMGNIIAGIYQGIRGGAFNVDSDFEKVCGRKHLTLSKMVEQFKKETR